MHWSSPDLWWGVQSRKHADLHMKGLSDLHMKGLTEEWMCLCCLRPEEVAKVLPHSGQAWARAPTCWERMCLCKLLGSVNTCWVETERERERVYIHSSRRCGRWCGVSREVMSGVYLWAVFTFIVFAAVVWHLVANQVGLPVEGLRALIALVFPLVGVRQRVRVETERRKTKCLNNVKKE